MKRLGQIVRGAFLEPVPQTASPATPAPAAHAVSHRTALRAITGPRVLAP